MSVNFSPSINIIRDNAKQINYIPTNNSKQIYQSIASNFASGLHSFTIIGSYGTGKSAFLVALENTLRGEQIFFERSDNNFNGIEDFQFINIVGSVNSVIDSVATEFDVKSNTKTILKHIKTQLSANKCLVIVIDEFGKFLEYAAKNNPDEELYFIQQLAELANDENHNLLFITTLHQNFDAYANDLDESQRKEWEKVKGRLKELTFNEPVEQLLALAAERINDKFVDLKKPTYPKELVKVIKANSIFPLRNQLKKAFVQQLYPFEPLSAAALTIALQRYGQNERSLFTFLDTKDYKGIQQFDIEKENYYSLASIYDYFYHNYFSTLTSRDKNHDYRSWTLIRNSIDRVEAIFENEEQEAALKIVKTIGLLNLLATKATKINNDFLKIYCKECLGIEKIDFILGQLAGSQIVRHQRYRDNYVLYEGSDIDIDGELDKLRSEVEPIKNISRALKKFLPLDFAAAKSASYKRGTPRFFQFEISERPLKTFNGNEIDGFVNLLFTDDIEKSEILEIVNQPILHAYFVETPNIKKKLHEIEVVDKLYKSIDNHKDAAKVEVSNERDFRIQSLKNYLNTVLFNNSNNVNWYFNGETITIKSRTDFNKMLSQICETIYHKTPTLRSELMNRHKLSSNVSLARRNLLRRVIDNYEEENLGFTASEFPPEKAIYFALLKNTGIHKEGRLGLHYFGEPTDDTFLELWNACNTFLESATVGKKSLTELVDILSRQPFKLKNGFLEFWLPIYLFIRRDEYTLYREDIYIPYLNFDILDALMRGIQKYQIKTFHIQGIRLELFNKYRELIRQPEVDNVKETSFINTIKPFIVFYNREINDYARKTNRISDDAKAFRKSVKGARELEKVFFEDLLTNFGVSLNDLAGSEDNLNGYVKRLRDAMRELTSVYANLIERIEENILEELGLVGQPFYQYLKAIKKRYQPLKNYLLTDKQKIFKARLFGQLDSPEKYFSSIATALVGKTLDKINDEQEFILHEKIKQGLRELDNLLEIANLDFEEKEETALQIEITSFNKEPVKHKVILSKSQSKKVNNLEQELRTVLERSDIKIQQAVLIKLLEKQLNGKSK
ncbi:MAG: hypothetical protein AB8G11_01835 [Saprospiraceae bacterium]